MIKEILDDAIYLNKNRRPKSSLLLLLCLIDAIAKKHYPLLSVGVRYSKYLNDRLTENGLGGSFRIEEKDKLINLGDIIYEYFRCFFVHAADDRTSSDYEVQIEYNNNGKERLNIDSMYAHFIAILNHNFLGFYIHFKHIILQSHNISS